MAEDEARDESNKADQPHQARQPAKAADSVTALWAGWFGVILTFAALGTFLIVVSYAPNSLGFGALAGVAVLSVSVTSLVILSRAVGISDASAALGLPPGSIRALLALGLAVVFVSVASWTLGGVFDPVGRLLAQATIPTKDLKDYLTHYPDTKYLVIQTPASATSGAGANEMTEVKVYVKRDVDPSLVDLAKQILTISSTVLVTIIGFYFGSNSAADAARTVREALAPPAPSAENKQSGSPSPGSDDVQKMANTITSIADSAKNKLQALGDDPLALLREAVAEAGGEAELASALGTASEQLAAARNKMTACATDADRAKEIAEAVRAAPNATTLKQANDRLRQVLADTTQAQHDFEEALAKFMTARDVILRKTAKG